MANHLQFKRSGANYSLQYSFNLIFKKIELAVFTLLCVVSLITSKVNPNFSKNVSMAFVEVSMPIVQTAAFPFNTIINLLTNFKELVEAKSENEALREENEKLRSFYVDALNINQENKELKNTLQFITAKSSNFKVARIIGRSHQIFNQQLFIDAGKDREITEGSIVSGTRAVIGRIAEVGEKKSRLLLATDAGSRIPIITSKARVRGILAGNNSGVMEILYLQKNHAIKEGDWVFTSGDGDTLPPGLLIGVVKKVDKGYASVEMVENISNADVVTVMSY